MERRPLNFFVNNPTLIGVSCQQTVIDALVMLSHIYIDIRTLADIREHILVRRRVHS